MSTKSNTEAANKYIKMLKPVKDLMPAADALKIFNTLIEAGRERAANEREIIRINAAREIFISEIDKKYELLHKVFNLIFEERSGAIDKHFLIIEKGLAVNDRELILGGLKGLSDIVSSSPFGSIEQLGKLLESSQPIEI